MNAPVTGFEPSSGYPGYPAYAGHDEGLTLAGVLHMLRRRLRLILAVATVVGAAAALALALRPAPYEAKALVLVDPGEQRIVAPEQSLSGLAISSALVDSEVEALNTRELAVRVTDRLNLRQDPDFNPALLEAPAGGTAAAQAGPDRVPDRVNGALEARRKGTTNVIELTARAKDPDKAAQLANGYAGAYLASLSDRGLQSARNAALWLGGRLEELRAEVNQAEAAAERFRAEAGLLTANGSTLSEQQSAEAQAALLTAQADLAEAQARQQQVRDLMARGGSPEAIAAVINSNLIRDLRGREADVARERAELLSRYGPRHPDLLRNAAELEDVRGRIQSEIERIAASLDGEVGVARARVANLQGRMNESRTQLAAGNGELAALRQLEREAAAARAVYESFLERSHALSEQGALSANRARLLSMAMPPSQSTAPSLAIVLLAAGILGLGAGVAAAWIAQQLDDTIDSADDVERQIGVPALSSIPEMPRKALRALPLDQMHPASYLVRHPLSAFAAALRVVRAAILYAPEGEAPRKVVAITSASPGEGKTTLSLCLARMAALSGERVALVDCDVRRRAVNDLLNIAPGAGLLEVLSGRSRWRDVIGRDEDSKAHILPLSTLATPLDDLIGSQAMRRLLAELREAYDLVILDCPPVLAVAETRALARMADMTMVVGRRGRTSARALSNAIQQIRVAGAQVGGVALNGVDPKAPGRTSYSDALYFEEAKAHSGEMDLPAEP